MRGLGDEVTGKVHTDKSRREFKGLAMWRNLASRGLGGRPRPGGHGHRAVRVVTIRGVCVLRGYTLRCIPPPRNLFPQSPPSSRDPGAVWRVGGHPSSGGRRLGLYFPFLASFLSFFSFGVSLGLFVFALRFLF